MGESGAHRQQTEADAFDLPSLLWPPNYPPKSRHGIRLGTATGDDLDVEPVVRALSGSAGVPGPAGPREPFVTGVLMELCPDPEVIRYRADVISNLLDEPALRERLADLLPQISSLVRDRQRPLYGREWTGGEIVQRLGELELYVDVVEGLEEALEKSSLRAAALAVLRTALQALIATEEFEALRVELPALRAQLDEVQSVTIGVNLSGDMRPESATVLSIDTEKIEGRGGLLGRLLGQEAARRGITRLRGEPRRSPFSFFPPMGSGGHARDNDLVEDLRRLLERVVAPVGEAIERYVWVQTRPFVALESELSFALNGVSLVQRLRGAGLPMCRPEIAPIEERICCLTEAYNAGLALRMMREASPPQGVDSAIVTNSITFDRTHGRVWILTGPNRGGKTTYARAVGLAHLLFQAGLYVPARTARLSPIDALYTHFPTTESTTPGEGHLDQEAGRLAEIFREATPHSLIVLNEVLSGTSTLEALALAHDAVRGLHLLGARAIYVTHLHDLANHIEEINATTGGDGTVGSLVAEVDEERDHGAIQHRRTFRIRPGSPLGISYASEIAEQHGISYRQLMRLLLDRGVMTDTESAVQPGLDTAER